jgi:hypothetical protein
MKWRLQITMRRIRNAIAVTLLVSALAIAGRRAAAQEAPPPDPRMLLNLDLFAPRASGSGSGATDESLFEQIRTLRAMGYLRKKAGADRDNGNANAGADVQEAQPSTSTSESSNDQSGPQRPGAGSIT